MRRTVMVLGVSVLLTGGACGDDDGGAEAGGSSGSFCEWMEENADQALVLNPDDPDFQEFLEEAQSLEVPSEIADEWALTIGIFAEEETPEELADLEPEERLDRLSEAGDRIEAYVRDECGLDRPPAD